ncbi:MAG: S8 family peptidase [Pseudomonadota bacterium]
MSPSDFETAEFNRNPSFDQVGLSTAYANGGTGEGVTIAVVDTGINANHPELVGQVDPNSADIVSNRSVNDIDGHGTLVAGVIAAARNDSAAHGVAFDSTILAVRADTVGSCTSDDDCRFSDPNLAAAIDFAIDQGVDIINLSLGGPIDGSQIGEDAVRRAAAAGILVVISAGNDGAASPEDPAYIAGQPESLGLVVAVGSLDANGNRSDFSNAAGADSQDFFLFAPGEDLITPGLNDDLFRVAGTSFSAPFVAGALALVLDAFPNLTPAEALQVLLTSADDLGAPGTDVVFGRGALNVARAFTPLGPTSISINRVETPLPTTPAVAAGPFSDWISNSGALNGLVYQDSFNRGFRIADLPTPSAATRTAPLAALGDNLRGSGAAAQIGASTVSLFVPSQLEDFTRPYQDDVDPSLTVSFTADRTALAFGRGSAPQSIRPSFSLVRPGVEANPAAEQNDTFGLVNGVQPTSWAQVSQRVTRSFFIDAAAIDGEDRSALEFGAGWRRGANAIRVAARSEQWSNPLLTLGVASPFGGNEGFDAQSVALEATHETLSGWTFAGYGEASRYAINVADGFSLSQAPWVSAWGASVSRAFGATALRLGVAQPPRAETGAVRFEAPIAIADDGELSFDFINASLAPSGREMDFETQLVQRLSPTQSLQATAAYILHPGHIAAAEPQSSLWISYRKDW